MINIETEQVFLLSDGSRTPGVKKSYHRLRWYILRGLPVKGPDSKRQFVRLEHVHLPGGMATSVEAYRRFIARINELRETYGD